MEKVGGGSGGAEGGGYLLRDEAAFADAGEKEGAAGDGGLLKTIKDGRKRLLEIGLETVGEGGEGGGFSTDDFCWGDGRAVACGLRGHRRDASRA